MISNDTTTYGSTSPNGKKGYTPRQLIKHHIDYPDDPITDEDMDNLELNISVTIYEKRDVRGVYSGK